MSASAQPDGGSLSLGTGVVPLRNAAAQAAEHERWERLRLIGGRRVVSGAGLGGAVALILADVLNVSGPRGPTPKSMVGPEMASAQDQGACAHLLSTRHPKSSPPH